MHGIETLAAALVQDADEIDEHVGVARRRLDRRRIAQIGLHGMNLADPAERLQMTGQFGPAHRDPDAVTALGQRAHHVAAEEAGPAVDRDQACRNWLFAVMLRSRSSAGRSAGSPANSRAGRGPYRAEKTLI